MTYPLETTYNLARSSKDYREANTFLKERGVKHPRLSFPTIIARRTDEVVGIVSNMQKQKRVTMSMWIDVGEGNGVFTLIRLCSCYDGILKGAGITKYWFWIPTNNGKLLNFCRKLSIYNELEGNSNPNLVWFERVL